MSRNTELVRALEKYSGGFFIERKQLAEFMGYSDPHSVDKYLFGLKRNGRRYFIKDVANQICELSE